jgi:hypothetical protein
MPALSRFFGIIIRMFVEPDSKHHTPHFHAEYNEHEAVYAISYGQRVARLSGSLPEKEERLVLAWAEIHRAELDTAWEKLTIRAWDKSLKIEPLH